MDANVQKFFDQLRSEVPTIDPTSLMIGLAFKFPDAMIERRGRLITLTWMKPPALGVAPEVVLKSVGGDLFEWSFVQPESLWNWMGEQGLQICFMRHSKGGLFEILGEIK